MITAQTVQFLDANNNNLSPAVCIDSIYYEGTDPDGDGATYRYALREKFVVGGEKLTDGEPPIPEVTKSKLIIPYVYAEKGLSNVWKIQSDLLNIADNVSTYVDIVCKDTYPKYGEVSTNFLDLDGNNQMRGSVKFSSGVEHTSEGIQMKSGNAVKSYVKVTADSVNIKTTNGSVNIESDTVNVGVTSDTKNINIGSENTVNTKLTIRGYREDIIANTSLNIISTEDFINIKAQSDINIDSEASSVYISAPMSGGTVSLKAKTIEFNNKAFPVPETADYKRILSATTQGEMTWEDTGSIIIDNYGAEGVSKTLSFVENNQLIPKMVKFRNSESTTDFAIMGTPEANAPIYIRDIVSGSSHESLSGNTGLNLKTINGGSLIGSEDLELTKKTDFEALTRVTKGDASNGAICIVTWSDDKNVSLTPSPSSVTIDGNEVHAESFVMSSDRELKEDIREDCFSREMPAIHGFKWKKDGKQSYGFIAQELEETGFEHLVSENPDGTKGVNYMAALSYKVAQLEAENKRLWEAIRELQHK